MKNIKTFESFKSIKTNEEYDGNGNSIDRDSSESANEILKDCRKKIDTIDDESKFSDLERDCETRLEVYDSEVSEFVIDSIFYDDNEDLSDEIIKIGDLILSKYGTEPIMVINAIEDCLSLIIKETV